ncbi:MAG: hypothetical protein ABSB76_07335 [Streptosporangiaceae bacterium]|jgi:hypothetical protein
MGQDLQRRTQGTLSQRSEPSWSAVAGTTVRLWLERHHIVNQRASGRRRRLAIVLSALVAMAVGAGITLAFTGADPQASPGARPSDAAQSTTALQQQAALYRQEAAKWVADQLSPGVLVSCDQATCDEVQQAGFPAGQLMVLAPTAPDPMGAAVIIASPAIRSQFGTRLASVYAPQVIAKFGSGPEEVDVRWLFPGGTAAFDAQQATDSKKRIAAGTQVASNQNLHASPAAKAELMAGEIDPDLVTTLGYLCHQTVVQLVAFTDSSPGEGYSVPLRGAEILAATPGALATISAVFHAQLAAFAPIHTVVAKNASGLSVVTVTYGAPSPMDQGGT